ncbi:formimidoylglutamase [Grimontia sp. NTOU-MAR1]|uniref:formimidoylglutamase n=1 Tax=Grimontia sp. NTOU-MAR1 TaxID=3111011 RepID=UPI002DB77F2E|nr:formimidoylglutamase [Grimontia sp. NTOU-MAR1]WRV98165.1 formimidoylglutamase [Grimontia sp. NTOU-MAR1]
MTIDMSVWQGRTDLEDGERGYRFHQKVQSADEAKKPGCMLIGFASDEGVSRNKGRVGAYSAPTEIRKMLANLPWHHHSLTFYDSGDVRCDDHDLAKAQRHLADNISEAMRQKHFPLILGGGHEVAWGTFQGLANHFLQKSHSEIPKIGIINFDAHFDLRTCAGNAQNGSSGTPFSQIAEFCQSRHWPFHYACLGVSRSSNTQALFDKARDLKVLVVEDTDFTATTIATIEDRLSTFISGVDALYLTIDIDVFPAAIAPGVSAPAVHGVDYALVESLIRSIGEAKDKDGLPKLKIADIAELNPRYDIDNHTSRLAARLVWTISRSLANDMVTDTKGVK